MFLVSSPRLAAAVSNAGGLGTLPSHNFRTPELLRAALGEVRSLTAQPFGVNLIVNRSNPYRQSHARECLDAGVPMLITSLGSPRDVIADAHRAGSRVFCDVVDLDYALKVQDMGADGVVAVGAGAGGHAGRTVLQVLLPQLTAALSIPVLAAGGLATGRGLLAALALGASGGYVGTRFIACEEAEVSPAYKQAVLDSTPDDILYTARVTGVHANFIRTPGLKGKGTELLWPERVLLVLGPTKRLARGLRLLYVNKRMARSAKGASAKKPWKDIWSAGQGVGLVHDVKPATQIVQDMVSEYESARAALPGLEI
jgi:nitronate monooxygenase